MAYKITTDEFIKRCSAIHGNRYKYSLTVYTNSHSPVRIICEKHGEFSQIAKVHLKGHGCPSCGGRARDAHRFFENAERVHGDRYDYSQTMFKHSQKPVSITCREHGKFSQIASNHTSGSGCPKCSIQKARLAKLSTTAEFVKRARAVHGDRYDYANSLYRSARNRISILCQIHGVFEQMAYSHLQGNGCPYCQGVIRSTKRFIEKAIKVHGSAYDYSQTAYRNSTTKVEVICNAHGPFLVTASEHLRGSGCPGCMVSHPEAVWLNSLGITERQKRILLPNGRFAYVDGFDEVNDTIYEFYGDFWHGNPAIYSGDLIHPKRGVPFAKIHQETIEREQHLRHLGYEVITMWEADFCLSDRGS